MKQITKNCRIYTDNIESKALEQVIEMANSEEYNKNKIRIMPDVHSGKDCVIGTTMKITDKVSPSLIGGDLGCGVLRTEIDNGGVELTKKDFEKLDKVIRENVPFGRNVHKKPLYKIESDEEFLKDIEETNESIGSYLGTLGGGNHFIEVDRSAKTGKYYLVIHTGSRHLGQSIYRYFQKKAIKNKTYISNPINKIIKELKKLGMEKYIQPIKEEIIKNKNKEKHISYLVGQDMLKYLAYMNEAVEFAIRNRALISSIIFYKMGWLLGDIVDNTHNYIDTDTRILRKGAIRANKGEEVTIPLNMYSGCLIGVGKGNADWNYSAPHGAGRVLSRTMAKKTLNMEDYTNVMKNIYSTSVSESTLDEAPMAYKSEEDIISNIKPTVKIQDRIVSVYNFKAEE